jgi:hypothetical protein
MQKIEINSIAGQAWAVHMIIFIESIFLDIGNGNKIHDPLKYISKWNYKVQSSHSRNSIQ